MKAVIDTERYRVRPGRKAAIEGWSTRDHGGLDQAAGERAFSHLLKRLVELQQLLYAQARHGLLVVLQGMDGGGKDSTIRHVFGPVNPEGCSVASFKVPTALEVSHDFLWRIHAATPPRGDIVVFNRSHYESVLVERVKGLVPPRVWKKRFDHINAFEKLLHDEGTQVVKFYLHISKAYQKQRLEKRLKRPDKHWKFNPLDLRERKRWPAYMAAYRDAVTRCSPKHAPWYVVPAEHHWFRNLLVATVLVERLESLHMSYPKASFNPREIKVP